MKLFFTLLFCLLLQTVYSQSVIQGAVLNQDQQPIVGATLLITGTNQGTVTDVEGKFSLSFNRSSNIVLRVSAIGYVAESINVDPANLVTGSFTVTLQEDEYRLQAVEITGRREDSYKNDVSFSGTKVASPIKDIPQSISFVTKELMVDQQAFTTGEVVKNMSGINQFSSYDDFTLRGFRSSNQLINGLRAGGIFWALPITANLERIEVIKGPASALFANTDPGGTINRVTKKPLDESRKSLQFSTGSFNTYRVALDFTGPMNEEKTLLYRLNVAYQDTESFRTLQGRTDMMVAPSFTFLPSDKTAINFDLVYSATRGKLDRGQPIFGASAGTDLFSTPISLAIAYVDDYLNIDNLFSTISLQHKFTEKTSLNVSYIKYLAQEDLQEHRTSNQFARDGDGNEIPTLMGMSTIRRFQRNYTDNLSAYLVHEFATGKIRHKLLGGYDYIQRVLPVGGATQNAGGYLRADGSGFINTFNPYNRDAYQFDQNGNPIPNVPHFNLANPRFTISNYENYLFINNPLTAAKYSVNGFYIQDQIEYNKLTLLLSLRQEFYTDLLGFGGSEEEEVTQAALIPRLGAVYALNKNINAYATYSQGYQPQGAGFIGSPEVFGGPFDPLTSRMGETGFKGEFFNRRLFATTAIYQITQNNILINANNPENPDLLAQRGQERARGIEFDLAGNITKNLSLTANYAYNRAIITESDNEQEIGEIKENAPLHQGGFWAKYVLTEGNLNGLGIALGGNFVSSRNTFSPILTLPSYFVADAALYYTVDKFRVSVNFRNLANQVHWVGGYDFNRLFPGEPRNFLATVAYNF
ncbi:TonB-dependent receptor [Arthrospiribacter ruber]|uniref:TonB-dependent receptor n=1 Tax=Arthrospiribacter ruber TaxID=2487934 RepID=A0A951MGR4_9BACT|nr:TonB-dependent receptor [Arthrospiribacter ruber]MBW3469585.1 TonB-dependent receptor [Arthrospiribacter ruber]